MAFVKDNQTDVGEIGFREAQHGKEPLGRHDFDRAEFLTRDEGDQIALCRNFVIGEAFREALGEVIA